MVDGRRLQVPFSVIGRPSLSSPTFPGPRPRVYRTPRSTLRSPHHGTLDVSPMVQSQSSLSASRFQLVYLLTCRSYVPCRLSDLSSAPDPSPVGTRRLLPPRTRTRPPPPPFSVSDGTPTPLPLYESDTKSLPGRTHRNLPCHSSCYFFPVARDQTTSLLGVGSTPSPRSLHHTSVRPPDPSPSSVVLTPPV